MTAKKRIKSKMDTNEVSVESTALLGLVADIRAAVGDPKGKLMQDELVEHCRKLAHDAMWIGEYEKLERENALLKATNDEVRRIAMERNAAEKWIKEAAPMLSTAACIVIDEAVHRLDEIAGVRAVLEACPIDLHAPCYADPLEDPKYHEWLEEMAKDCHCPPAYNRPCEGVCAGGPCDDSHWEPDDDYA